MDTPTGMSLGSQAVVSRRASRGWFIAFWVGLALVLGLIVFVGLQPVCLFSCAPVGAGNFVLIAIPTAIVGLVALFVHRGLRSGSTVAKVVLVVIVLPSALYALLILVGAVFELWASQWTDVLE